MLPRRGPLLLLVGGLALVVLGGAVLALAPVGQLGWFAYAPLPEAVSPPGVVLGTARLWGAGALAVGLVASSWAAGYLAGRRVRTR